mgnify:CR=1 FL=1
MKIFLKWLSLINSFLGAVYKIIRPDYVNPILAEIKRLTNG